MQEIFYFMISYAIIIFGGFLFINWLSNGYLWRFMRVKSTREKKVLVWSRGATQYNFYIGEVVEKFLIFRDNACKLESRDSKKRLAVPGGALFRAMGIINVVVDEETNCVLKTNLVGVPGFDPIKWNNILVRALKKPSLKDNSLLMVLILIAVGVCLLILVALFIKIGQVQKAVEALGTITTGAVV